MKSSINGLYLSIPMWSYIEKIYRSSLWHLTGNRETGGLELTRWGSKMHDQESAFALLQWVNKPKHFVSNGYLVLPHRRIRSCMLLLIHRLDHYFLPILHSALMLYFRVFEGRCRVFILTHPPWRRDNLLNHVDTAWLSKGVSANRSIVARLRESSWMKRMRWRMQNPVASITNIRDLITGSSRLRLLERKWREIRDPSPVREFASTKIATVKNVMDAIVVWIGNAKKVVMKTDVTRMKSSEMRFKSNVIAVATKEIRKETKKLHISDNILTAWDAEMNSYCQ